MKANNNKEYQDVVAKYDAICRNIIDNMDSVKQFKRDFNESYEKVCRFNARYDSFEKLSHFIKLIKNRREENRLAIIYDTYYDIYNESVVKYVKEETGELDVDLHDPTYKYKPNHMDTYVKSLKLKK